jgi:preprotein translocase subunit YajC
MIFTLAFADTANAIAPGAPAAPSTFSMLLPFGLMFVVFYFLLIRPQQKKVKDHENMVKGLQKGEEVVTNSGIIGRIHGLTDKVVTLEVDNNVKIKVLKSQVASVVRGDQPLA